MQLDNVYVSQASLQHLTLSKVEAEHLTDESLINIERPVLISITGPVDEPAKLQVTCPILRLKFDDIEYPNPDELTIIPMFPFTKEIAIQIFQFLEEHKPGTIIVHCHAGVCRSAAVNAALCKILYNQDDWYFKTKVPNMLVYTTMLSYWHCDLVHGYKESHPEISAPVLYPWLYQIYIDNLPKDRED